METVKRVAVEWGVASRTLAGEPESGDRCLVITQPEGALLAVADGLGHGEEAARAADLAMRTVERHAPEPLIDILKSCHQSLQRTRGVALSLARWELRERLVTWIGVGNVEGLVLQADEFMRPACRKLVLRGGVVGVRLPSLQVSPVPVPGPALLILATDGITGGFEQGLSMFAKPKPVADQILASYARESDDSTVLVARLGG